MALAVLTCSLASCDPTDDPENQTTETFYYKSALPGTQMFPSATNLKDITAMNGLHAGSFTANRNEMMRGLSMGDTLTEVFDSLYNRIFPVVTQITPSDHRSLASYRTFCGNDYTIVSYSSKSYAAIWNQTDTMGNPLTSIYTSSEYWTRNDHAAFQDMRKLGFVYSYDLNNGAGIETDYVRAYFAGLNYAGVTSNYYKDQVITGLRLVKGDGENAADVITDAEGIRWQLVPSKAGNHDLNNNAGGDYLYLYYTTDYTGRKLYLTNPYFKKYVITDDESNNNDHLATALLGVISTWDTTDSKASTADLIEAAAKAVAESNYPQLADVVRTNFDFVKLYDTHMNPVTQNGDDKCPADFNRKAGGDFLYISYSFITPSDSIYWEKY